MAFQEEASKQPTSKFKKAELLAWFQERNIPTEPDMTNKELLALCKIH